MPHKDQPEAMSLDGLYTLAFYEGFESTAYWDSTGKVWTIGFGHTSAAGPPEVYEGMTISFEEGVEILKNDLKSFEGYVKQYVNVPLNQRQFDAMVSWTYNLGPGNLSSSTLLKRLNSKEYDLVPHEILKWDNSGGQQLRGLTRRRGTEAGLFMVGNADGVRTYRGDEPNPDIAIDITEGETPDKEVPNIS